MGLPNMHVPKPTRTESAAGPALAEAEAGPGTGTVQLYERKTKPYTGASNLSHGGASWKGLMTPKI